jgi:hypothetical protein
MFARAWDRLTHGQRVSCYYAVGVLAWLAAYWLVTTYPEECFLGFLTFMGILVLTCVLYGPIYFILALIKEKL